MNAPPIKGPITDEIPKIAPRRPWYMGRLCSGTMGIMMTITPEKTPADPEPAIARPRINAVDVGAAPHSAEPASKSAMEMRKTDLLLKKV